MRRDPKRGTALAFAVALAIACGAERASAEAATIEPAKEPAGPAIWAPVNEWFERAAEAYRTDVADKLSVPREPVAADVASWLPPPLKVAVEAALRYIDFWLSRALVAAGLPPVGDPAARAAADFIEARRKADEDWRTAQEKLAKTADAGASEMLKLGDAEAAKQKRKEELAKKKEELDRRIEDGLKKLEEFEKASKAKKDEEERRALEEKRKSEAEAARKADEERKAAEEMRLADLKADEARKKAEAAARTADEAAAARKADEERKAAEEMRLADLKAEEARKKAEAAARMADEAKAVEEAARKADEELKAAEQRRIEQRRVEESRARAAEPEVARADVAGSAPSKKLVPPASVEKASPAPVEPATAEPPPVRLAEREASRAEEPAPRKVGADVRAKSKPARKALRSPPRQCRAKSSKRSYVVRPGDTLSGIARRVLRNGGGAVALYHANRWQIRNPNHIYPCQRLRLPKKHA